MRSLAIPISLLGLAVLGLALTLADPPHAEEIRVTVIAILATTEKNAPVEKELVAVAEAIKQTYPDFTGFRRGTVTAKPLAIGQEDSFPLVDEESATVSIMQGLDKKEKIRVKVKPPGLNEITMNCCCGKFVPFLTPYETKTKKERLIVAVMVKPCPGK